LQKKIQTLEHRQPTALLIMAGAIRHHIPDFSAASAPTQEPGSVNKILLSACLLGNPVRYDGKSKTLHNSTLDNLLSQDRVISFCPEVAGGLPVPRPAAEIHYGDGAAVIAKLAAVKTQDGSDVSEYFLSGAQQALALCHQHHITVAVLTESSPSCGSSQIYDGSFLRRAIPGSGVTAALLRQHGIKVFNQHQLGEACRHLEACSSKAPSR
jgi:uncharacterized protein YbbK (DUF523 family)